VNEPEDRRTAPGFAAAALIAIGTIYAGSTAIDLLRGADRGAWVAAGVCFAAGLLAGWGVVTWGRARRDREPGVDVIVVAAIVFLVIESIALWASDTLNARTNAVIVGIGLAVIARTLPDAICSAVSDRRNGQQTLRTPPPTPDP
jgi:cation transport ATPase